MEKSIINYGIDPKSEASKEATVTFRLDNELLRRLSVEAEQIGMTKSDIVRHLLINEFY